MITVGIAAYKEPNIQKAIDGVMAQGIKEDFEIIVACPDESTALIVKGSMKFNKYLKLVKEEKREGQPAAYNKIIKAAKGRLVIFTDADAILGKDSLNKIIHAYSDTKVGAAGGRPMPLNDRNDKFGFWAHYLFEMAHNQVRMKQVKQGNFYYIAGPLCSIRRGVIKDIPTEALATDAVLGMLIREKGWKVVYVPDAMVYQKAPTTLSDIIKQKRRTMAGFYQIKQWGLNIPKGQRSFLNEALGGLLEGLKYSKSLKEVLWFVELCFIRILVWALAFYDIRIKKRSLVDLWKPIESSK
jgi:biofilm PGA synthesis N-glycosyltransferase PgaC